MLGISLNACSSPARVEIEAPQPAVYASATASPTVTATHTATPTAPALALTDNRPEIPQTPNPLGLVARCGIADFFDYPLDPPDADSVTGGQDFGDYRQRYEGFHTGEDWWYERRSSLGKPIFSIGNGRVRYVAPYGWGDDLGTLVIEHIGPNGRHLFSFYGHVDPDSLTLRVGQCVERGQQVGQIGDPRSSPHLHFEIRTIFADGPGPGYWSIDPAKSGWLPPSQTIEFSRYAADQRVDWWRATATTRQRSLGWLDEDVILNQEDAELVALHGQSGEVVLRQLLEGLGVYAAWHPQSRTVFIADMSGSIQAYAIEQSGSSGELYRLDEQAHWSHTFGGRGAIQVVALEDGVVVTRRDLWTAFDGSGNVLWVVEPDALLVDWVEIGAGVLAVTSGEQADLWSLTQEGAQVWEVHQTGELIRVGAEAFLYSETGLFRLDFETLDIDPVASWSRARLGQAELLTMDGAGFLLLHKDAFDFRLLRLAQDGRLLWERSLRAIEADDAYLMRCGSDILLMAEQDRPSSVQVELLRLDAQGNAERIFQTIVRADYGAESWATCVADTGILISLGGPRQIRFNLSLE
jgi:murein DD-endopeptidase MepM/ murein hydrolase activator NlpD